ncbi:GerAB/ArcD/ProY family transporter [Inediibacterium massiliense]|uniref:GerAB/ArcD/ProY family transporter n=1 Tax=Inediibacterium massiliense TaxID=1658111 RepID=UPI0006B48ADA|nr:endospore germination permease [Inediibacterium massiliense]
MNIEKISTKQGISLIILFIVGSSSIFAQGLEAGHDLWLAFIIGIGMVIPMIMIYARLHCLFPNKNLFDMIEICFGKIIGKIIVILYTWFVFFMMSDILLNYSQFVQGVSFIETPHTVIHILFILICAWGIKEGIEVMGRCSELFIYIPILSICFIVLLSIPNMEINNILPVLSKGMKPVFKGAFSIMTFPLIQIVVFTMVFDDIKNNQSMYKIYLLGMIIGGVYLFMLSITNILVVGVEGATSLYYPTYGTISRIKIGNILQRIEVIISVVFLLGGFIKISILLLCTCKGIAKVFNMKEYRFIVLPMSLLGVNLAYFQYDSVMDYFEFNRDIWPYYHFPFQIIFPIILWIVAEKKKNPLTIDHKE